MIGSVTEEFDAVVRLAVRGSQGQLEPFDAVIDTGFNGWLSLPPSMINDLELRWKRQGRAILADGSERDFDIYDAVISWNGQLSRIQIDECDTMPLIGMRLLEGFQLLINVQPEGSVEIRTLPIG